MENYILKPGKIRENNFWRKKIYFFLDLRMETYTELCSRMLRQFQNLLRHYPCVFGKQQLVQMMAINMYQIEVAKQVNVSGILFFIPKKNKLQLNKINF